MRFVHYIKASYKVNSKKRYHCYRNKFQKSRRDFFNGGKEGYKAIVRKKRYYKRKARGGRYRGVPRNVQWNIFIIPVKKAEKLFC